ncbi:PREDICTED: splicing factor, proline- and glutamine-rich-like [Nanorana parkeri]|uniref:splicing factor, proline- and glutamine-rich-like n=1 Tax=Nanorana parkeri TaxID=125878 RepID=UPI00085481A1|nr:PREDICTED: splicing factor, proline- and glutamine-rich-like [Nanorana parkeri]
MCMLDPAPPLACSSPLSDHLTHSVSSFLFLTFVPLRAVTFNPGVGLAVSAGDHGEGSSGLGPPRTAPPHHPECPPEHAPSSGNAHHHQEQRHQPRRVHLLLQTPHASPHRARPVLPAPQSGDGGDSAGHLV